ncbi:hypothetical protein [Nocardioides sambongensis]|uniref:hypothetical protein n=1 Tax=Nocardioides sambongensis TaxID=2589074 RepID=UPI00112CC8D4|nr:hypothetical protein [Nocardioides sambongensis]
MTTAQPVTAAAPRTVGYAYPWDVIGDPDFSSRVLDLGVDTVALAASYHTARAATPLHPTTRFVNASSAALYRPIRDEAWSGRRLVPAPATWVPDPDPFGTAAATLIEAGVDVAAWIVLTHATRLGEAHPDLAVVNCFGERYPYALSPQSAEVREYAATLAAEAIRDVPCSTVILEACGQLGVTHGGHHEKTDGAYDHVAQRLLSIDCSLASVEAWEAHGLDPERVVAELRAGVDATLRSPGGSVPAVDQALLDTLLEIRHQATDELRRTVISAVGSVAGGDLRLVLHAEPDPWATGALPGLTATGPDDVDAVVAQCWPVADASVEKVRSLSQTLAGRAATGAYVTALPPTTDAAFGDYLTELEAAGVDELHLYHLGLAGPDRQPMLAAAAGRARTTGEEAGR